SCTRWNTTCTTASDPAPTAFAVRLKEASFGRPLFCPRKNRRVGLTHQRCWPEQRCPAGGGGLRLRLTHPTPGHGQQGRAQPGHPSPAAAAHERGLPKEASWVAREN